jgi:hypothetical protein
MDTLKDKLPILGIGLAAVAIAGYIVFGLDKGDKKKTRDEPEEEHIEAEPTAPAVAAPKSPRLEGRPEIHFIPENLSQSEKMTMIEEWVEKQIKNIMKDGDLTL